jgi:predicted Zn-dependent peptidase
MKSRRFASVVLLLGVACAASCGGSVAAPPAPPAPPAGEAPEPDARLEPPPPGLAPERAFPAVEHRRLANGLELRAVRFGSYPISEIRLVVRSGLASDGDATGLALLAGEMMKAGGAGTMGPRQLLERAESLGTSLDIVTSRDTTTISLPVTKHNLDAALEILSALVQKPRFDAGEFAKLKQREIERVSSLARTSGDWAAEMVLYRTLFELQTGVHGYSQPDATPEALKKITLQDCRRWHATHVTPNNAFLVVAGDIDGSTLETAAARWLGDWKGKAPPPPVLSQPLPPSGTTVYIADRPGSAQSEVMLATLGPERRSDRWAALRVTDQILGGGVAGRLFLDVREKRSLAYSTYSSLVPVAQGPVPIIVSVGTQTAKTEEAIAALLEHFELIGKDAPADAEVEIASRYLSDSFLLRMESAGQIADLTVHLGVHRLPDDYYDSYRKAVREVTPASVLETASRYFRKGTGVIVVSGDAASIKHTLTRFGPVHVVDPENGFRTRELIKLPK